jgi:hypothetical protein
MFTREVPLAWIDYEQRTLAEELERLHKPYVLKIYPL